MKKKNDYEPYFGTKLMLAFGGLGLGIASVWYAPVWAKLFIATLVVIHVLDRMDGAK